VSAADARRLGNSPWTRVDAAMAAAVVAVGCLVWAIGWWRVAYEPAFRAQIATFDLALVGVVLAGAGQLVWFLGGRRAVDQRRRALLGDDAVPVTEPAPRTVSGEDSFAGTQRLYHRLSCPLVIDRGWSPETRADHEYAGRSACGVCAP
jgi:hypothetical protein